MHGDRTLLKCRLNTDGRVGVCRKSQFTVMKIQCRFADSIYSFGINLNLQIQCLVEVSNTVNDESLEGLKFGESAKKSIWRKKVWRISPRILLVYNILAICWRIKFGEISQFAKFAKLWSLQTFVVYGNQFPVIASMT